MDYFFNSCLRPYLQKQPAQESAAKALAAEKGADLTQWLYLPVVGRQDWVAPCSTSRGRFNAF